MTDSLHPRLSERVATECSLRFVDEWREWPEWEARLEMIVDGGMGFHKVPLFHRLMMKDGERQDEEARAEKVSAWLATLVDEPLEDGVGWFTTEVVSDRLKLFLAYMDAQIEGKEHA